MPKKSKKSQMEEELEAMSKGRTCTKEDGEDRVIAIIKKHARNIDRTKLQYLDEDQNEMYAMYANIQSAFDLLLEEIKSEGFAV